MPYDYDLEPDIINEAQSCADVSIDSRDGIRIIGHVYHYGTWAWAYADDALMRDPVRAGMSAALRASPEGACCERRLREFLMRLYLAVERSRLTLAPHEIAAMIRLEFPEIEGGTIAITGFKVLEENRIGTLFQTRNPF